MIIGCESWRDGAEGATTTLGLWLRREGACCTMIGDLERERER